MSKYSFEFKKKVVMAYLNGEGGEKFLASKFNIASPRQIKVWIKSYQAFGDEGLTRSRKKNDYSFEYKLHVVELYLSSEVSYQDLALQEKINTPGLICKWVNDFRVVGPDALRPRKKGRKKPLNKPKMESPTQQTEEKTVDTSAEHVKELEDELLKLRIENAFLKELRRLRLEDEAKMRERLGSSPVSEDSSD